LGFITIYLRYHFEVVSKEITFICDNYFSNPHIY